MDGLQTGNQELTKIGARRLFMLAAGAAAASGYGVSSMINRKHGVSEEQERATKTFAQDYVKDSPLAFGAPVNNGEVQFVQMNYLLPTGLVTAAIEDGINAAKEDGLWAGAKAAARSVASQFTSFGDDGNPFGPAVTTIGKALGIINEDDFGLPSGSIIPFPIKTALTPVIDSLLKGLIPRPFVALFHKAPIKFTDLESGERMSFSHLNAAVAAFMVPSPASTILLESPAFWIVPANSSRNTGLTNTPAQLS